MSPDVSPNFLGGQSSRATTLGMVNSTRGCRSDHVEVQLARIGGAVLCYSHPRLAGVNLEGEPSWAQAVGRMALVASGVSRVPLSASSQGW